MHNHICVFSLWYIVQDISLNVYQIVIRKKVWSKSFIPSCHKKVLLYMYFVVNTFYAYKLCYAGSVLRTVKKKHKLWKKWRETKDANTELKYKKQVNKPAKQLN